MSKIQTIEQKRVDAEVLAQRRAFISVSGKEPRTHDTLTETGYLSCWNEELELVGGPFTEQGESLLAKLKSKADFFAISSWYHPAFPAFLFRALYVNFISDVSFSKLKDWYSLDYSAYSETELGLEKWLNACLGNGYEVEQYELLGNLFREHSSRKTYLLKTAADWADKQSVRIQQELASSEFIDEDDVITPEVFKNKVLPFLLCAPAPYARTLYKQAKARLIVEQEIYKELFGADLGEWSAAEYSASNWEKLEQGNSWYYDFLAVKIAEIVPKEFIWGYVRDHKTGEILNAPLPEEAQRIWGQVARIESRLAWQFLYHPKFVGPFIKKLTKISKHNIDNSPAKVRNTSTWLETHFTRYTNTEDLQYFLDVLQSDQVSIKNKAVPSVKKAIEWIKFRLALPKDNKLQKENTQLNFQDKALAEIHDSNFDFSKDFPLYRYAHLYSFFCSLPQTQADAVLNDLIVKGGMWAPSVKSAFKIPLNPDDEEDRAFLLADELASISLLKIKTSELSPSEKANTIAAEWEKYWIINEFDSPKNTENSSAFLNEHERTADYFGRQIPYHKSFPAWWTETIQTTPVYNLEATLTREMVRLSSLFTSNWQSQLSAKDVQYLSMILVEAAEREAGTPAQRLLSAVTWLNNYRQGISKVEQLPIALAETNSSLATQSNTSVLPDLFDKLCGGLKPEQLMRVVGQEGLGLYDASRKAPTDTATSTNWALLYWGLQHKGFLPAGLSAGKASELLKGAFGAAVSKTRINDTKPGLGEKPRGYLARVIALLDTL